MFSANAFNLDWSKILLLGKAMWEKIAMNFIEISLINLRALEFCHLNVTNIGQYGYVQNVKMNLHI